MLSSYRKSALPLVTMDQVLSVDDSRICVRKAITGSEPFFIGHYPDEPIYPGVFIIETVRQAVSYYAMKKLTVSAELVEVHSTRFLSPIFPGDKLDSNCICTLRSDRINLDVKADCYTVEKKIAEIKLIFRLIDVVSLVDVV